MNDRQLKLLGITRESWIDKVTARLAHISTCYSKWSAI